MSSIKHRPLGNTGMHVSPLGFGTVKFGRDQQVKYPKSFSIPNDKEAANLLSIAKDAGINLLDTAPAYGNSEERLGKLIAGQRKDWLICTKTGEEFINNQSSFDFSASHTRQSVERSLRRLNTDYLDIVLIHSNGDDLHIINHTPVLETLLELQQQGLVRAIGMSTKTVDGGLKAAELTDIVMVTFNLHEQSEKIVLDYAKQKNKGILIKKALASGHICQQTAAQNQTHPGLQFVLSQDGISSIIIGTINPNHLKHNIDNVCDIIK